MATYTLENKVNLFSSLTSKQISNIYNIDCANYIYKLSATVVFDSEYTNYHGYWTGDDDTLLSEYGTSYPTYVYDSNATIKTYVDTYKEKLENKYNVTISNARLISYEELDTLGCKSLDMTCMTNEVIENNRTWLFDTSFWSGSASAKSMVWIVDTHGSFAESGLNNAFQYGVRPVLEISKDEFN